MVFVRKKIYISVRIRAKNEHEWVFEYQIEIKIISFDIVSCRLPIKIYIFGESHR